MNKIQAQDIKRFVESFELANDLQYTKFLITGATGLIGSTLINCLIALNQNIKILAPVRNKQKALDMFESTDIVFYECDLQTFDYDTIGEVDYIVHSAAPTSSKFFVEQPVETAEIIYGPSSALLKYAVKHPVKGFLYLSSLEVYGSIVGKDSITEDMQGYLDLMDVRSSYPMAKRMVENLCCLYTKEYGIKAMIARLTQTTGAGIAKDDNRVIAQFARLGAQGKDIVLHTRGESARPYCYTTDAISAILYILLRGKAGQAYNVANEQTYISVRDMAEFVKKHINTSINVRVELNNNMGYAPVCLLPLSVEKLKDLGWMPIYDLRDIFNKLVEYLND